MSRLTELLQPAVKRGRFVLASGRESDVYLDVMELMRSPASLRKLARAVWLEAYYHNLWGRLFPKGALCGVATGGLVVATGLWAFEFQAGDRVPLLCWSPYRPATRKALDGPALEPGSHVLVVDDVATTGRTLLAACRDLQDAGYQVVAALALVEREDGEARERLAEAGIELVALTRLTEEGKVRKACPAHT